LQQELPVEINVFDILYYNGKSLLNESFKKRTALIRKIVSPKNYKIKCSKQIITSDEKKATEFYKDALKDNQEGVMMKNLDSKYNPGSRVGHMLKIKPDERDLDLVIVGAEYGTGKRSGWMSSFILACEDKGKFVEIGKMGTGIKEKEEEGTSFAELTKRLTPLVIKEKGKTVEIKPKVVVSVTYQEIQKSPNYNSGFALRFPRLAALRVDKHLSEIATLKEIEEDFSNQKRNYQYG
jgi:DNA ligase 1